MFIMMQICIFMLSYRFCIIFIHVFLILRSELLLIFDFNQRYIIHKSVCTKEYSPVKPLRHHFPFFRKSGTHL